MVNRGTALVILTLAIMLGLAAAGVQQGPGVGWASYHIDIYDVPPPEPEPELKYPLTVSPAAVCPGESISFSGQGATSGTELGAYMQNAPAGLLVSTTLFVQFSNVTAGPDGSFASSAAVPTTIDIDTAAIWPRSEQQFVANSWAGPVDPFPPAGEWTVVAYDPQSGYEAAGSFTVLNCSLAPDNTPFAPDTLPTSLPSTGAPYLYVVLAGLLGAPAGGGLLLLSRRHR